MDLGSSLGDRWVDVLEDQGFAPPSFSDASYPAAHPSSIQSGKNAAGSGERPGRRLDQSGAGTPGLISTADLSLWAQHSPDLLPSERLLWQERAMLVNTLETGHLVLSNLRVLFLRQQPSQSDECGAVECSCLSVHEFGSPFFTTVERVSKTSARLPTGCLPASTNHPFTHPIHWTRQLQIHTKDGRILAYALEDRPGPKQQHLQYLQQQQHQHNLQQLQIQGAFSIADAITRLLPKSVRDLAAFQTGCGGLNTRPVSPPPHVSSSALPPHGSSRAQDGNPSNRLRGSECGPDILGSTSAAERAAAEGRHTESSSTASRHTESSSTSSRHTGSSSTPEGRHNVASSTASRHIESSTTASRHTESSSTMEGRNTGSNPTASRHTGSSTSAEGRHTGGSPTATSPGEPVREAPGGRASFSPGAVRGRYTGGVGRGSGQGFEEYERVLGQLPLQYRRCWRISDVNKSYHLCHTYPQHIVLPADFRDEEAFQAATFRARGRIPVFCWQHPDTGAVLSRSSQPLVGIMMNNRCETDERLVSLLNGSVQQTLVPVPATADVASATTTLLSVTSDVAPQDGSRLSMERGAEAARDPPLNIRSCSPQGMAAQIPTKDPSTLPSDPTQRRSSPGPTTGLGSNCTGVVSNLSQPRRMVVADARPRKNALANGAMGGGSESATSYKNTEVVYLGIENIHVVRDSLHRLREFLDTHGGTTSDGAVSLLKSGGSGWAGGSVSSSAQVAQALADTGWLQHLHTLLAGAAYIATLIATEGTSVLVHCSDGWDRTPSLVTLALIMLDPYYRTFDGFQSLVELHWASFGHQFAERLGVPGEPPRGPMECCTLASSPNRRCSPAPSSSTGNSSSSATGSASSSSSTMGRRRDSLSSFAPLYDPTQHLATTSSTLNTTNLSGPFSLSTSVHAQSYSVGVPAAALSRAASPPPALAAFADSPLSSVATSVAPLPQPNQAPIFLQWIDAVAQLLRLYPQHFEFTVQFLVDFLDATLACRFTNFLGNSERERCIIKERQCSCRTAGPPLDDLSPNSLEAGGACPGVARSHDWGLGAGQETAFIPGEKRRPGEGGEEGILGERRRPGEGGMEGCIWAHLRQLREGAFKRLGHDSQRCNGCNSAPHSSREESSVSNREGSAVSIGTQQCRSSCSKTRIVESGLGHDHWNALYLAPSSHPHEQQQLLQLLPPAAPLCPVLIPELHFRCSPSPFPSASSFSASSASSASSANPRLQDANSLVIPNPVSPEHARAFYAAAQHNQGGEGGRKTHLASAVAALNVRPNAMLLELRRLHQEISSAVQREADVRKKLSEVEAEARGLQDQLRSTERELHSTRHQLAEESDAHRLTQRQLAEESHAHRLTQHQLAEESDAHRLTQHRLAEESDAHRLARQGTESARAALQSLTQALYAMGCECSVRSHVEVLSHAEVRSHAEVLSSTCAAAAGVEDLNDLGGTSVVRGSQWFSHPHGVQSGQDCLEGFLSPQGDGGRQQLAAASLLASSRGSLSSLPPFASTPCLGSITHAPLAPPAVSTYNSPRHTNQPGFQVSVEVKSGSSLCVPTLLGEAGAGDHGCNRRIHGAASGMHARSSSAGRGLNHHCQPIMTGLQADFDALRCTPIAEYFGAEIREKSHRREGTASAL